MSLTGITLKDISEIAEKLQFGKLEMIRINKDWIIVMEDDKPKYAVETHELDFIKSYDPLKGTQ